MRDENQAQYLAVFAGPPSRPRLPSGRHPSSKETSSRCSDRYIEGSHGKTIDSQRPQECQIKTKTIPAYQTNTVTGTGSWKFVSRTLGSRALLRDVTCELVILPAIFGMLNTISGRWGPTVINAGRAIGIAIGRVAVDDFVCVVMVVGIRTVGREGIMHGVGRGYSIRSKVRIVGYALSGGDLREAAVSDVTKVLPGNRSVRESNERQAVLLYLVGWWPTGTSQSRRLTAVLVRIGWFLHENCALACGSRRGHRRIY